jgi:hypothetical protein
VRQENGGLYMFLGYYTGIAMAIQSSATQEKADKSPPDRYRYFPSLKNSKERCCVIKTRREPDTVCLYGYDDRYISGSVKSRRKREINRIDTRFDEYRACQDNPALDLRSAADLDEIICGSGSANASETKTHHGRNASSAFYLDRSNREWFSRVNSISYVFNLGPPARTDNTAENIRATINGGDKTLGDRTIIVYHHWI